MPESRRYQVKSEEVNRLVAAILDAAATPADRRSLYQQLLTTVLKLGEDGAAVSDLKVTNTALKEMRYSFKVFAP